MARARTLTLKTDVKVTGADKLNSLGKKLQTTGKNLTIGLTLPLAALGGSLVALAEKQERAEAKLTASFDSMGAAAWTSVDALKAQASALQDVTTFGDEEILELQSVLLTFGNVAGESFDRATAAALDMSALLGTDLQSSAIQLGKALNDPIKGITALTRVGVSFTEAQKDQIRTLTESGDIMAAQGLILDELDRQFGNAAENLAGTTGGQLKQALNAIGDAGEQFGAVMAPALKDVANGIKDFAKWLQQLNPETKTWIVRIGLAVAALGPLLLIVGSVVRVVSGFKAAFFALKAIPGIITPIAAKIGAAMTLMTGPIGIVVAALAALALAFATDFLGIRTAVTGAIDDMALNFGDMGDAVHELADNAGVDFQVMKDRIKAEMEETGQSFEQVVRRIKLGTEAMTDAQWDAVEESGNAWAEQRNIISDATYGEGGMVPTIQAGVDDMAAEMGEAPGKMADELLAAQFHLTDATQQLVDFMDEALTPAQERFQLQGFLASAELAEGLTSNNPLIRTKAEEMQQAALDRLAEIRSSFWTSGSSAGYAFGQGLTDPATLGFVSGSAARLAAAARGIFPDSEPKDPNSPFRGITKGFRFGEILAKGLLNSGQSAVQSAFTQLAGSGLNLPTGIRAPSPAGVPAGTGGDIHVHLTVMGDLRADERTLPGTLRRALSVGV